MLGVGDNVDGLHRLLRRSIRAGWLLQRITPMAKNMQIRLIVLHHAVGVVDLLGQAHRIHLAAHPTDFARILAAVRVGVGKIDRSIAGPLRMGRIGIGDAVLPILPIAGDAGQREALRGV